MLAGVVGSIGGLPHANIDASWLLVPMMSGTRRTAPALAASIGCCGRRSTPCVSPNASVGVCGRTHRLQLPRGAPQLALRQPLDLVDADTEAFEETVGPDAPWSRGPRSGVAPDSGRWHARTTRRRPGWPAAPTPMSHRPIRRRPSRARDRRRTRRCCRAPTPGPRSDPAGTGCRRSPHRDRSVRSHRTRQVDRSRSPRRRRPSLPAATRCRAAVGPHRRRRHRRESTP